MSASTIREQISQAADKLLPAALHEAGISFHTRKKGDWRNCPCEWCSTKREATVVIASHWPKVRGHYVEDLRDGWREMRRREYRQKLNALKGS